MNNSPVNQIVLFACIAVVAIATFATGAAHAEGGMAGIGGMGGGLKGIGGMGGGFKGIGGMGGGCKGIGGMGGGCRGIGDMGGNFDNTKYSRYGQQNQNGYVDGRQKFGQFGHPMDATSNTSSATTSENRWNMSNYQSNPSSHGGPLSSLLALAVVHREHQMAPVAEEQTQHPNYSTTRSSYAAEKLATDVENVMKSTLFGAFHGFNPSAVSGQSMPAPTRPMDNGMGMGGFHIYRGE